MPSIESPIMERVRAHFASFGEQKLEVPEWGSTIHWSPLTLEERSVLNRSQSSDDIKLMAEVIIMKARDAEGKPLFTIADRQGLLQKADPLVIARIANRMTGEPRPGEPALGES